nr:RDD family protein [Nocardioides sp. zg-DK7169]
MTDDDLVTGEAVALDLPPASLALRIASGLMDVSLAAVLLVAVGLVATTATLRTDEALAWVAFIATLVTVLVVVPAATETLTRGRTLGKWALGLRTVRDDAGPISFHHAFVRALLGVVEVYALSGAPAFLSALVNGRGKRLGDHAAGTYVVRERVRLHLPPPPVLPPELAGWARTADIRPLPTGLALAVRQYLGRAATLTPPARAEVGGRLAGQVLERVAPPPPPGTPPEAFLAAVVATRRERDTERLAREAALVRRLTGRG